MGSGFRLIGIWAVHGLVNDCASLTVNSVEQRVRIQAGEALD